MAVKARGFFFGEGVGGIPAAGKSKQNNELKIRLICIVEFELIEAVR